MQPVPAAVTAWRYVKSCTSPEAKTPGTEVCVVRGATSMYPFGVRIDLPSNVAAFSRCPVAPRRGYPTLEIRAPRRCYQMSRTEKKFDAVAMMRSIRDRISVEIEGMTLEEERVWLASQEIRDPFLKRLRDRAAKQADLAGGASRHR